MVFVLKWKSDFQNQENTTSRGRKEIWSTLLLYHMSFCFLLVISICQASLISSSKYGAWAWNTHSSAESWDPKPSFCYCWAYLPSAAPHCAPPPGHLMGMRGGPSVSQSVKRLFRLRSWSQSSWVLAPPWALCWQLRAWSLLGILSPSLSVPPLLTLLSLSQK